ncbi:MAG: hypothetical protein L0Y50_07815, partial [Beijerinckiaceae bacterium]|nr:hypothetical protein [Beijerinckiaceae bacterium]MCI0736163.1 hypothetical protein [Beijerinckiaceae bacterium]
ASGAKSRRKHQNNKPKTSKLSRHHMPVRQKETPQPPKISWRAAGDFARIPAYVFDAPFRPGKLGEA